MFLPLDKRQFINRCNYNNDPGCSSSWYDWGRWVVFVLVIVACASFFFICSCMSSRRRRRAGQQPFYGTGWASRHGAPEYNPNGYGPGNANFQPAPPYEPAAGNTGPASAPPNYASHTGYYGQGHQQNQYELQTPGGSYQPAGRERSEYQAPEGPPPGKKNGHGI